MKKKRIIWVIGLAVFTYSIFTTQSAMSEGILDKLIKKLAGKREDARVIATKADVEANIPVALDMYEMDVDEYPQSLENLIQNPGAEGWDGPYFRKIPRDPWNYDYKYICPGVHNPDGYDLSSYGPDGVESEDDITNWK